MSRPAQPCVNHDVEVMILARAGISFSAISERCGGTIDRCKWVWHRLATADDERSRFIAKGAARIITKRQLQSVDDGLKAPKRERFSKNAFGNNVDPIEYGKATPPDDARQSSTGCAALMASCS